MINRPFGADGSRPAGRDTAVSHSGLTMQRFLIALGLLFVIAGLLWPWLSKLPFGHLAGDLSIEREHFSVHLPLMTSLVLSVVLTLLLWWSRKEHLEVTLSWHGAADRRSRHVERESRAMWLRAA